MGCQERSLLWWVMFFTFVLRGIYAFQAYSPALIPVMREVKEHSNISHVLLASDVHPSGSPPAISPSRQVVKEPSSPTHSPLASDAQPLGHSLVISPAPHEVKKPSDIVPAPLANQHAPVNYPMPLKAEPPSIVPNAPMASHSPPSGFSPMVSPVPDEAKKSPDIARAPMASHLPPSRSYPATSPPSQEVKESSNVTRDPLAAHLSPSGSSPAISPVPQEVKDPSNDTRLPMPSHLHPSGTSPTISPVPQEVKDPSNITRSPLASHLHTSGSSPATSPVPEEVNDPSTDTHAPMASHLHPSVSPPSQEAKDPTNITHAPSASHLHSSGSSPAISPVHEEVKDPSNITRAPLASHLHTSGSSPATSPVPEEVKDPSTDTHAPMDSHLHPSLSPPSQEAKDPTNITHAPSASHLHSSVSSPAISPVPQEVKDPSNITRAPLASHLHTSGSSPATSPVPEELKDPSTDTHAPMTSHLHPSPSPPSQEAKDPTNITHAPSASHLHSSVSSPAISPVPQEVKDPSNGTHVSPDSHFQSSGSSPATSPVPQEVKEPSNVTHAPVASHLHPSVSSPTISPVPEELKHPSNDTHAPLAAHPNPSRSSPLMSSAPLKVNETHPYPLETSPVMSPLAHKVRNPSISTLAPSASHSNQSGSVTLSPSPLPINSTSHLRDSSPVMSPALHEVETPNVRHAPKASVLYPLVSPPVISPKRHEVNNASNNTHAPMASHPPHSSGIIILSPSSAPTVSIPHHSSSTRTGNPVSAPLSPFPLASYDPGPAITPSPLPATFPQNKRSHHAPPSYIQVHSPSHPPEVSPYNNQRHHVPTPNVQVPFVSPIQPSFPPTDREKSYASSPSSVLPSPLYNWPSSPTIPPSGSFSKMKRAPLLQPMWTFPPPPPNLDCKSLTCLDPLTYPPPGSLCACVLPIKVGLRLGIALYTFFSLVSELAEEIASGIFMKQSQVRVMGANAATDDPEKTIALIYLVPLGRSFDISAALLVYERFFRKQILISASNFGGYDVLYVIYPGLPPSPPMAPTNYDGGGNGNAGAIRPLAVHPKKQKQRLSGSLVAIIVLLSVLALVLSIGAAWLLLLKYSGCSNLRAQTSQILVPSFAKSSGVAPMISRPSSTSASFSSSLAAYTGSAKTFSLEEIERATDKFHDSRIIGEGGFGRVYSGTLDDGIMVAVKVLKRDDQQGGREFLAEVEMLSRLHHRNLVKLIGICTEVNARCLVYELVPNGSLESHLHGPDKETTSLDWNARMKIALGAARGLAYLHEDSSPRVIHRDFKSSNILLEHDFTPKVSDFGLARTAVDEENQHISTRVMGTFGYVAPEYAMTGHLLVKSDVYSYGVVLLELLTGRKPVDMSQPPGEENLVAWARPLLTSTDGLQSMVDPALGTDVSSDSITKVAAIASMCVQPEVSHRPFMGEVVQALKLVCGESDEHRRSGSGSHDESSTRDSEIIIGIRQNLEESDIFCNSAQFSMDASGSFRRHSSSGPLQRGRSTTLWQRVMGFSSGSMNEAGGTRRLGNSSEGSERWP